MKLNTLGDGKLRVSEICLGATDLAQLKQNIHSIKVELDAETLAGIDAIQHGPTTAGLEP
jgi:aryl-alcohol dehydrogenase-like predicted oxidoreductase